MMLFDTGAPIFPMITVIASYHPIVFSRLATCMIYTAISHRVLNTNLQNNMGIYIEPTSSLALTTKLLLWLHYLNNFDILSTSRYMHNGVIVFLLLYTKSFPVTTRPMGFVFIGAVYRSLWTKDLLIIARRQHCEPPGHFESYSGFPFNLKTIS